MPDKSLDDLDAFAREWERADRPEPWKGFYAMRPAVILGVTAELRAHRAAQVRRRWQPVLAEHWKLMDECRRQRKDAPQARMDEVADWWRLLVAEANVAGERVLTLSRCMMVPKAESRVLAITGVVDHAAVDRVPMLQLDAGGYLRADEVEQYVRVEAPETNR